MKWLKKDFLLILSLIILTIYFIVALPVAFKEIDLYRSGVYETHLRCLNDEEYYQMFKDSCDNVGSTYYPTDFYYNYFYIISSKVAKVVYIMPLFLLIPALFNISKYFKSKEIKNDLTRKKYSTIKKDLFKEAYKPLLLLLVFIGIITYTIYYSKGIKSLFSVIHINSSIALALWPYYLHHPLLLIIMQLLTILIHFILYINIGLIIIRKYHNYFIAVLLSYLTLIGIEVFLEVFLNVIICNFILKTSIGEIFNIFNYMYFDSHISILSPFLVPLILMILSFVIIHFIYKNKEKLLIDCEKN